MKLSELHLNWGGSIYNGVKYRTYSLARSYREKGKNRKEIVQKLGRLTDAEVVEWKRALKAAKNAQQVTSLSDNIVVQSNKSYLDVAVVREAWNLWGLNEIFDGLEKRRGRSQPLSAIAAALTINRCIDPVSKSKISTWYERTALPYIQNLPSSAVNSARIFRELACIEECRGRLCQHLYQKMRQNFPEAMDELFYDLSSTTFSGTRCVLMKWGHCKEGYENHVVLALVVNSIGLPIYWEILPGGTADATTISWLLKQLQQTISAKLPTLVFDRGMVSEDNLSLLEANGIKYISAMDKNQIETLTRVDFSQYLHLTPENVDTQVSALPNFIEVSENLYCKEIRVVGNRRYVLCFNPQLFRDQQKARNEALKGLEEQIKILNKELLTAQRDRSLKSTQKKFQECVTKSKLQGFISIELEEVWLQRDDAVTVTYQGESTVNLDKMRQAGKLDGFWLLVTNHSERNEAGFEKEMKSVVEPYREKVVIESSFRDIKSFVDISPIHVWTTAHVHAHYTICVLAHLLNRTLSLQLHKRPGEESGDIVAHGALYDELSQCNLNHLVCEKVEMHTLTQPTCKQGDLLKRLNMTHLVSSAMISSLNERARVAS